MIDWGKVRWRIAAGLAWFAARSHSPCLLDSIVFFSSCSPTSHKLLTLYSATDVSRLINLYTRQLVSEKTVWSKRFISKIRAGPPQDPVIGRIGNFFRSGREKKKIPQKKNSRPARESLQQSSFKSFDIFVSVIAYAAYPSCYTSVPFIHLLSRRTSPYRSPPTHTTILLHRRPSLCSQDASRVEEERP